MSSFYLRYRLHLKDQELTFLGMVTTFSQCITLECIQQKFRTHFNKSIKRKTIIDYFNHVKVRVTVDYDLCFSYDYEPPKLKFCYLPKESLKDRKYCKKISIIIDVLQMTVLHFDTNMALAHDDYYSSSDNDSPDYFLQFDKKKVFMLVASCCGKILYCKTYTNYDDIYPDTDIMFNRICDDLSKNSAKTKKCLFILGPSLPLTTSFNNSNNQPIETLTSESITSEDDIDVAPRYESTRVENCPSGLQESFSQNIGTSYLLARGHSVIIGKFNTSPYLMPLLEVASYWKNYLESKLRHCRHFNRILRESENYIQKLNFKKYFNNFPAIS